MSNPQTVLFIDNSGTFGGAINSLGHLVRSLDATTVTPHVTSAQPADTLSRLFPSGSWTHLPMEHRGASAPRSGQDTGDRSLGRLTTRIRNLGAFVSQDLMRAVRYAHLGWKVGAKAIHLNNGLGQLDGMLAAKMLRIPCVAHSRGFHYTSDGQSIRFARTLVDRHVAISTAIRENLIGLGMPPDRIVLIHDGIQVGHFPTGSEPGGLRRELGIPSDAPVLGFSGRVIQWKGVREFLNASIRVMDRLPEARALVIGDYSDGGSEYFEEVQSLASSSKHRDRIIFSGYREDIPNLMKLVDVLVHTSIEAEPFGMVLIEAMAAGTPVVAANAGGPLDIVLEGETGYLADPENAEEVAAKVLTILQDGDLRRAMGEAAGKRVRACFTAETCARQINELYRSIFRPAVS